VRDRYVIQVLLATFGFGLLLAIVAVLQTPDGSYLQSAHGSGEPTESRQGPAGAAPLQTTRAKNLADDFRAECEIPAKLIDDCPQPKAQKICQRTSAPHEKASTLAN